MSPKTIRRLAILATATLALGAFVAAPAEAKKKKKPKPPPACAAYTPWEKAAEAEITKVTDAATAEAPVEVTVSTAEGLGFSSAAPEDDELGTFVTHAWSNVQVDSAASDTFLYVRVEFGEAFDYDIFARNPDGSSEYYAAGGYPWAGPNDGTGHGGHSEMGAENIDGIPTADCQGYSLDLSSAITPGGDVTVKYWLGEAPAA